MAMILGGVGSIFRSGTRLNLAAGLPYGEVDNDNQDSDSIVTGGEDKEVKLD